MNYALRHISTRQSGCTSVVRESGVMGGIRAIVQALGALSVPVAAPSREPLRLHAAVLGAACAGAVSVG